MFNRSDSNNNGTFEKISSDVLNEINSYLKPIDIKQLNKFFNHCAKELELKKEQKLYVMYSLMIKQKFDDQDAIKYNQNHDTKIYLRDLHNLQDPNTKICCLRDHLDNLLFNSKDEFLKEIKIVFSEKAIALDAENYQKQFDKIIISSEISEDILDNVDSLYLFLSALCSVEAVNALAIFVKKYPNAIKRLSTDEFNSLCVVTASNHLFGFMNHLCEQDKSIDEYAIVNYRHCIWDGIVTPLLAAFLSLVDNSTFSEPRLIKAKKTIALLLENHADPNKKYIVDDFFDEALIDELNKGNGCSIIESCEEALAKYENGTHIILTKSYANVFIDVLHYILSLKPMPNQKLMP